jgi:dolichol kinase
VTPGRRPRPPRAGRPASPHRAIDPARYSESARKCVHIAFGGAALLLRYLTWWQAAVLAAAAVVFNIRLLRWLTGNRIHRPDELNRELPAGLVLYPTSVLLLLLLFPSRLDIVAAAWGILAAGDGAATLVGLRYGVKKWPWNRR